MKRLNRKGFTLIELLAVIVILAIVVGITLVTVLPTLSNARQEAFELTAQTAADYLEKQYQTYLVGDLAGESSDITFSGDIVDTTKGVSMTTGNFANAGLKPENYASGKWYINKATGRACVELKAATRTWANEKSSERQAGEYYDADPDTVRSTGCQ